MQTTAVRTVTIAAPTVTAPVPGTTAARPGSQWPPYSYTGPANLCTQPTFPEPALIKAGASYNTVTLSAQSALVALGYDGVVTNGVMDSGTVSALTRFQANHGLITDGSLGRQSWNALRSSLIQTNKC